MTNPTIGQPPADGSATSSLARLATLGFRRVGKWRFESGRLDFVLDERAEDQSGILYAFTSGQEVLYIGKSVGSLYQRMAGYRTPGPSQKTNVRNKDFILKTLAAGSDVHIHVFFSDEKVIFRGFEISVAAGLEDALIAELSPRWNVLGR
jgi:hypothetical protein